MRVGPKIMWWLDPDSSEYCVILAHGDPPSLELFKTYKTSAKFFIALDGATTWALENNTVPDLVIGDLDSFPELDWPKANCMFIADQDSNDLEKGLLYCHENNLHRVMILGAFGQRIDHLLTNLYVIRKYAANMQLCIADDNQVAFIQKPGEKIEILNMNNCFLSLFPLDERTGPITSTGVKYPLSQEFLYSKKRIGTLNRIIKNRATIYCESGELLIVMPHRFLNA